MRFVNWLHPHENNHCWRVAQEEHLGWLAMYPERYRKHDADLTGYWGG
jgi:hypothetical protein